MHNLEIAAIAGIVVVGTYMLMSAKGVSAENLIDNVPYSKYFGIRRDSMEGFDEDANGATRRRRRVARGGSRQGDGDASHSRNWSRQSRSRRGSRGSRRGGQRRVSRRSPPPSVRANRTGASGMVIGAVPQQQANDLGVNVMAYPPRGVQRKPCAKSEPDYWSGQEKGKCVPSGCFNSRGTIPFNALGTNKVRMLKPVSNKLYENKTGPVFTADRIVTGLKPGDNPLANKNFINATQGHYIIPEVPPKRLGIKDIRGNPKLHLTKQTHCFENIYDENDMRYVGINYGNL